LLLARSMPHQEAWRIFQEGLFTQVRGRGILGNTFAGSCIESRSQFMRGLLSALVARDGVLHTVVAHNDSGTRITTGPIEHP
jgi:hypothetical protein